MGKGTPRREVFWLSDDTTISEAELKAADRETQIDAMRNWFYQNFEDPVNETPFDSGEGGYQYIHGGPYDAQEELTSQFEDSVPPDVIEELTEELENQCSEWAPRSSSDYDLTDYDEYTLDSLAPVSEHIKTFNASIDNILKLIGTTDDQFLRRLLFASAITSLETYLSDVFVSSIRGNPTALRRFVESFPDFAKEKLTKRDIFREFEQLEHRVTAMLVKMVWHRLERVATMFGDTFGINFTESPVLAELMRDVEIRHDIVHRSGKNKDGLEHKLADDDVRNLTGRCIALVQEIERQRGGLQSLV
jgi:HEPN superfamily RiboL-PSP-like protein